MLPAYNWTALVGGNYQVLLIKLVFRLSMCNYRTFIRTFFLSLCVCLFSTPHGKAIILLCHDTTASYHRSGETVQRLKYRLVSALLQRIVKYTQKDFTSSVRHQTSSEMHLRWRSLIFFNDCQNIFTPCVCVSDAVKIRSVWNHSSLRQPSLKIPVNSNCDSIRWRDPIQWHIYCARWWHCHLHDKYPWYTIM